MQGELNNSEIEDLLRSQVVGRIGCHSDGKPYIVPITYAFDGQYILGHTSEGLKVDILRQNPSICFQVDKVDNMTNWQSVIVWGLFEELQGYEARLAMQKLIAHMEDLNNRDQNGIETHQLETGGIKTVVYRINIFEKTGRFEKRYE
jgi:uncharacterized protein